MPAKRTSVGQEIVQGAKEVLAAMRGEKRKGHGAHRQKSREPARAALRFARAPQKTAGRMHVIPSVDVTAVRRRLKLSQAQFAAAFGLSLDSVKNWEQGHRSPEGPAKVLLAVIAKDPQAVQNALAAYR
jgi:putative transcriptional regulator